jgi:hypothetical protein
MHVFANAKYNSADQKNNTKKAVARTLDQNTDNLATKPFPGGNTLQASQT